MVKRWHRRLSQFLCSIWGRYNFTLDSHQNFDPLLSNIEHSIHKTIEKSNIRHPKILKRYVDNNGFFYSIIEYYICNFQLPLTINALFFFADGGRCFSFSPKDDTIYLVGTDDGVVYKCTTEYSSLFLKTYEAHTMPVYSICWNPFVPSIFLTCAADWLIKIWDERST